MAQQLANSWKQQRALVGHTELLLAGLCTLQDCHCHSAGLSLASWHFTKLDILTRRRLGRLSEGSTQLGLSSCPGSAVGCSVTNQICECNSKVQWPQVVSPASSL